MARACIAVVGFLLFCSPISASRPAIAEVQRPMSALEHDADFATAHGMRHHAKDDLEDSPLFEVELNRQGKRSGITLMEVKGGTPGTGTFKVTKVYEDSAAAEWNAAHPDRQIQVNDLIYEMNGQRGNQPGGIMKMAAEYNDQSKPTLQMKLVKDGGRYPDWIVDATEADVQAYLEAQAWIADCYSKPGASFGKCHNARCCYATYFVENGVKVYDLTWQYRLKRGDRKPKEPWCTHGTEPVGSLCWNHGKTIKWTSTSKKYCENPKGYNGDAEREVAPQLIPVQKNGITTYKEAYVADRKSTYEYYTTEVRGINTFDPNPKVQDKLNQYGYCAGKVLDLPDGDGRWSCPVHPNSVNPRYKEKDGPSPCERYTDAIHGGDDGFISADQLARRRF